MTMKHRHTSNRLVVLIESMRNECRGPARFISTAAEVVRQLHLLLEDREGRMNCMGRLYLTETLKFLVARYSSVRASLDICGIMIKGGHVDCSTLDFNVATVYLYINQLEGQAVATEQAWLPTPGWSNNIRPERPQAPTPRSAQRRSQPAAVGRERSWEAMADQWPGPPPLQLSSATSPNVARAEQWRAPDAVDLDGLAVKLGTLEATQAHFVTQLEYMKEQQYASLTVIGELSGVVKGYLQTEQRPATAAASFAPAPVPPQHARSPKRRGTPRGLPQLVISPTDELLPSLPVPEPELELGVMEANFFEYAAQPPNHNSLVTGDTSERLLVFVVKPTSMEMAS